MDGLGYIKGVELREQWSKCLQSWPLATVAEPEALETAVATGRTAHMTPASWLQWRGPFDRREPSSSSDGGSCDLDPLGHSSGEF